MVGVHDDIYSSIDQIKVNNDVQGVTFKSTRDKIWSYSLTKRLVENKRTVLELLVIGLQNICSVIMT